MRIGTEFFFLGTFGKRQVCPSFHFVSCVFPFPRCTCGIKKTTKNTKQKEHLPMCIARKKMNNVFVVCVRVFLMTRIPCHLFLYVSFVRVYAVWTTRLRFGILARACPGKVKNTSVKSLFCNGLARVLRCPFFPEPGVRGKNSGILGGWCRHSLLFSARFLAVFLGFYFCDLCWLCINVLFGSRPIEFLDYFSGLRIGR